MGRDVHGDRGFFLGVGGGDLGEMGCMRLALDCSG